MLNGVPGMIGETGVVTRTVVDAQHPGWIRARGEQWLAIPIDLSDPIEPGTTVVITGVSGGSLVVMAV